MSRSTSSRKVTPFIMSCKVCMDAGLSETQYKSHNVKNVNGKVCCPTLLSNVCRRCDKFGHSEKYCTVQIKSTAIKTNKVIPLIAANSVSAVNPFDTLGDSGDISDDDFPANVTMRKPKTVKAKDWADYDSDDEDIDEGFFKLGGNRRFPPYPLP